MKDDGVGFNPEHMPAHSSNGHFGLAQVRERVQLLRGEMNVSSRPAGGTTVSIQLPLVEEAGDSGRNAADDA